jgi:hypothetical protein
LPHLRKALEHCWKSTPSEFCDNLIFRRRAALDKLGERLLDANRTIGQPNKDPVKTPIAKADAVLVMDQADKWNAPIVEAPKRRRDEFVDAYPSPSIETARRHRAAHRG